MRRSAWAKMTCRKILTTTNRIGVHTDVVSCRFRFTAKLWKGFAHERNATVEDERMFKDGMEPLIESGRLIGACRSWKEPQR
jgi:hypothetical protein